MNERLVVKASCILCEGQQRDLPRSVCKLVVLGDSVVANWVEFAKGLLLFLMVPGDERSGEFYIYDRKRGSFWLLTLPDEVFGGYSLAEMRQKIKEFRLLDYAEDPSRLRALRG